MEDLKRYLENTPHGQQALAEGCYLDLAAAEKFRQFAAQFLKVTVGPMAGQPFILLDWQYRDVVAPILGWKKADGTRLIRSAFISLAKKGGKSALAAALLLYFILTEGPRAEIYSAACTRDQASIIFREAAAMLKASKALQKYISSRPSSKTLVAADSNSFYRALSADAGSSDGINASVVYVDELHQWISRELLDTLAYSGQSRPNHLTFTITTAGESLEAGGPWADEYRKAKNWLAGLYKDTSYYARIWEADPADDIQSPATWRKALPSLGITVPEETIAKQAKEAAENPAVLPRFKRFILNIPQSLMNTWLDIGKWDAAPAIDTEALKGVPCFAGLDLSSVNDLTALVLLWPHEDKSFSVVPYFWLPVENLRALEKQHHVSYSAWVKSGHIRTTPGNAVDYDFMVKDIGEIAKQYPIRAIGLDRLFQGQAVENRLTGLGFDVVPCGAGWVTQSLPCKEIEAAVLSARIRHGGHPVLRWHASNVVAIRDAADNVSISKKKSRSKIDGIAALVNAWFMHLNAGTLEATPSKKDYSQFYEASAAKQAKGEDAPMLAVL